MTGAKNNCNIRPVKPADLKIGFLAIPVEGPEMKAQSAWEINKHRINHGTII